MYIELNLYNNFSEDESLRDIIYNAIENNIQGIVVSHTRISEARQYLPKSMILSCMIDYPFGLSDTKVRQHSCLLALKKGANSIDLCVNKLFSTKTAKHKIIKELTSINNICADNDAYFRVITDYRTLSDQELLSFAEILMECGIRYMVPSTGQFIDDYVDNVMSGMIINEKYEDMNVITNGNIWTAKQYDSIDKSGIFGLRLNSPKNLSFVKCGV